MNNNVEIRQVEVVRTADVRDVRPNDTKQITPQFQEDDEAVVVKEQKAGLKNIQTFTYLAILLAIAQIVLASIHLANHKLGLAKALLAAGIVYLLVAGLTIYWANKTKKSYKRTTAELLQPRPNDRLTRTHFVIGLVLAATATALLVNCLVQREYSPDYVTAQTTTSHIWNDKYGEERTEQGLSKMLRIFLIVQAVINGIFIIYFAALARTAFRSLKWDNQAMSYLAFLGNVLLLGLGLAVVYLAHNAYGYGDYPQVRAHFPVWNIKALFFLGLFAAVTGLIGFLVDHRSWRVGFFVLTFLLVTLIVLLGNFTGLAYRHTNNTYNYYKGTHDASTCLNRMGLTDTAELEHFGCPAKYLEAVNCPANQRVTRWEPFPPQQTTTTADARTATPTTTVTGTTPTPAATTATPVTTATTATPGTTTSTTGTHATTTGTHTFMYDDMLVDALTEAAVGDVNTVYYCLNEKCCGLQGQVYGDDLLRLANFGLFTILAAILLTIACSYFWYVKWIDTARDKRKDFAWLAIMIFILVAFVVAFAVRKEPLVSEQTGTGGRHI